MAYYGKIIGKRSKGENNMNKGTKIRTILAVATSLNTALMATDITGFHNGTLDMVYKVVSIVLNFVIVACVTYFNNDYTPEGETGTLTTRQMKELKDYYWTPAEEPEDAEVSGNDD